MRPLDPAMTMGLSLEWFTVPPAGHATGPVAASVAAVSTRLLIALSLLCGLAILVAFAFVACCCRALLLLVFAFQLLIR